VRLKRRCGGLAAVLVLVLTGCSTTFHPGTAAMVDGEGIAPSSIDNLVLAACDYAKQARLSQGGAAPTQSMATLRFGITQALIQFALLDKAAEQLGLTVSDAKVASVASATRMPPGLSASSRSLLARFFSESAKAQLQQAVIGAHLRDPKITTADSVSQDDLKTAAPYVKKFAAKQHVVVDPSYGRWNGTTLVAASGSLSDPVSVTPTPPGANSADAVTDLPPSQVCG
jgi:SurA-like N-terminal domain